MDRRTARLLLDAIRDEDHEDVLAVALSNPASLATHEGSGGEPGRLRPGHAPRDRVPWVGLLEIHARWQGRGVGREAAEALVGWARDAGAPAQRAGVDDGNDRAAAFWAACGFVEVEGRERPSPQGPLGVTVVERHTR